ncbi:MAG: DUF3084 domain-containing protein [Cyanobacteriota bacterium ELA615]|jgi:hypothetical protein
MTSAYVLIVATLVLGGLIAALGDRLGSKVGKARLRLFKLRPKQTAVVVTVVTGTLISASTLAILFTLSKSLRQGLFELDDILAKRRLVTEELQKVKKEKENIERHFSSTLSQQTIVQNQLNVTKDKYQKANNQLSKLSKQSSTLNSEINNLTNERAELLEQKTGLDGQITKLQSQIDNKDLALQDKEKILKNQESQFKQIQQQKIKLQLDVDKKDQAISNLDREILQKNQDLQTKERRTKALEGEQTFLEREVQALEQYYQNYQDLREKNIAILRGQVLAMGALKIVDSKAVNNAINQLLNQANKNAISSVKSQASDSNERLVQITNDQVDQLAKQIGDGQEHVIRILSGGNYVQGEKEVRVFADVAPNKKIFNRDQVIASVSLEKNSISDDNFQKQVDSLLVAAQFKARKEGIVGKIQIEDGKIKTLIDFISSLSSLDPSPDQIKVIATENAYTIGPLKLRLEASSRGKIILSTE